MDPVSREQPNIPALRDALTGRLIGLARATDGNEHLISEASTALLTKSLFALSQGSCSAQTLELLLEQALEEKRNMVPDCFVCAAPCGKNNDYDMNDLNQDDDDIRSMKQLLLLGLRGVGANAYHAGLLGYHEETVDRFLYKGLIAIGIEGWNRDSLLPILLELGEVSQAATALLDRTH